MRDRFLNIGASHEVMRSTSFSPIVGPAGVNGPALPSLAAGTNYTNYRSPARFLQARILKLGFNLTW